MTRKALLCTATSMLAVALACGKSAPAPTSPSATTQPEAGAAADGSTLKSTTPTIVSPAGGAQVTDPLTLTSSKATGKFVDLALSYQFQVRSGSTVVYDSGATGGVGSGNNVSHTLPSSAALNPDTDYTWRVRAAYQGAVGSWSADGSFKSPVGAFIRGNEVRDPLTIGRTVGILQGATQFIPGEGLKLLANDSTVKYELPTTLTSGQFSMLIKGADEGSPGDKSKVFSMQQGNDSDITTNSYRFTAELRGRNYSAPGSVTCRVIAGDGVSRDCVRIVKNFTSTRWYFWKFSWNEGTNFTMEVREDSETGRIIYTDTRGLSGRIYRPNPHMLYLGAPVGRAGPIDATLPGGIYKNVYVGPNARPTFPQ